MDPQPTETDLLAAYRASLTDYARDNLLIRTKAATQVPFTFNRAQAVVHRKLSEQLAATGRVRAIILKARQEGISTYTAARFYRRVSLYENQQALVIADLRKRGQTLFGIYELFDKKLPAWIKPATQWQRKGWTLHYDDASGDGLNSILTVETAKDAAAGRGSTIQAIHASELAFWENPEVVWTSLMQAVPDLASEVIVESTANGVGNMFWQMWQDAEAGDSSYLPIFLPWWIHEEYRALLSPSAKAELLDSLSDAEETLLATTFTFEGEQVVLTLEQIAWRRQTIKDKLNNDEALFSQEYPATAREAFLVSGNCFFDEDVLLDYETRASAPRRFKIARTAGAVTRQADPRGRLRIWHDPEDDGEYVIFADTATGKMSGGREAIYAADREQGGRDFSAAWVYDVKKLRYVALLHGRIVPEIFADQLNMLGAYYSHPNKRTGNRISALVGVERNHSSGETVVRRLKDDLSYPNLFFDRQLNHRRNRMTPIAGWMTTEAKRTIMLDEFSAELRSGTVTLPDADTIRECFTFVRDDSGKPQAQDGCHDDRVIAAAGCLQMARHHRVPGVASARTLVRRGGPVGHLAEEEEEHGRQGSSRHTAERRG